MYISPEAVEKARVYRAVSPALLVILILLLGSRLYVRIRPTWRFGWDDAFALIGSVSFNTSDRRNQLTKGKQILTIVDWGLQLPQMITHVGIISDETAVQVIKKSYLAIPVCVFAMASTKISVAITLLRIRQARYWNIFLYTIIGVQVVYALFNTLFILLQCRPLSSAWHPHLTAKDCPSLRIMSIVAVTSSSINVATDILLSAAPLHFLPNLQIPRQQKLLLGVLMALGLCASAASIRKTLIVKDWDNAPILELWNMGIDIALWVMIEQYLACIATAAVCARAVLRRVGGHFGWGVDEVDEIGSVAHDQASRLESGLVSKPSSHTETERGSHIHGVTGAVLM